MFCKQCGKELKNGVKFCTNCGTTIKIKPIESKPLDYSREINKQLEPDKVVPVMEEKGSMFVDRAPSDGNMPIIDNEINNKKGKGRFLVVLIVILVILIVGVSGAAFWLLGGRDMIYDVIGVNTDNYNHIEENEEKEADHESLDEEDYEKVNIDLPLVEEEKFNTVEDSETAEEKNTIDEENLETVEESEYILENSDVEYLTKKDLVGFSAEQCRLARNELYARHGRLFDDENLQKYFDNCSWYQGRIPASDFEESMLSEVEIANRDLIVEYEKEMGYR